MKSTFYASSLEKDFLRTIVGVLSESKKPKETPIINEKLEPHEEDEVDTWDSERPEHVEDAIHSVFGHESRIEFPLQQTEIAPHPDVEDHLNKHGVVITNYLDGKAKDKYNRETTIGRALTRTKASDQVINAYNNDPQRQQKQSGLKVVISHHPYDVAGMTSGHQSWLNQSCMNFKTGSMRDKLHEDVRYGTHVAYLTDHDDKDLERPVARIAVKPYHDDEGHVVYRPEQKVYGNAGSSFTHAVSNWFEDHYPAKEGQTYHKNSHVYNDSGDEEFTEHSKEDLESAARGETKLGVIPRSKMNVVMPALLKHQEENPKEHAISKFLDRNKPALSINQVNVLYKKAKDTGQDFATEKLALRHGDVLNKENLEHAVSTTHLPSAVLRHRYLPQHIIDSLSLDDVSRLHPANITSNHVDRAIQAYNNGESGSYYTMKELMPHGNKDHLHKLIDMGRGRVDDAVKTILNHPHSDKEITDKLFNKVKATGIPLFMDTFALHNKNPTPEHAEYASNRVALSAIMRNATDEKTHSIALNKALDAGHRITLTHNSAQFINHDDADKLIKHIQSPSGNGIAIDSSAVYGKLLDHSLNKVKAANEALTKNPDDESKQQDLWNHLESHAGLATDAISHEKENLESADPVSKHLLDKIHDHVNTITNLEHYPSGRYDGTHEDVAYNLRKLKNSIEG